MQLNLVQVFTRTMSVGTASTAIWLAALLWPVPPALAQHQGPAITSSLPATLPAHAPKRPSLLTTDQVADALPQHDRFDDPGAKAGSQAVPSASGLRIPTGSFGYVEGYGVEWTAEEDAHSFDVLRRAIGYSAGTRQVLRLGKPGLEASFGIRFDSMPGDPTMGRGTRDGRELEAGLGWNLPGSVGARAFYGYRNNSTDSFGQDKERHRIRLEIGHNISDWLRVRASFLSKIHDSSALLPSERGRYLACIGFEAKY